MRGKCDQLFVFRTVTADDHTAYQLQKSTLLYSFKSKCFHHAHSLRKQSPLDQDLQKGFPVDHGIFPIIHHLQTGIQIFSLHVIPIIIQDLFADQPLIFIGKRRWKDQFLKNSQILTTDLLTLTVIQKHSRFIRPFFQHCRNHLTIIKKWCQIIIYRSSITSLFFILKYNGRIFAADPWVSDSMDTRIDFFLFHLSVTDDHTADLRIIRIQPAGKHSGGDHLRFFAVRWFPHEFLINSGIIFIHPAFP